MSKMNKDESLTKKVLLSIMAAGVMSGFVFQAEAADTLSWTAIRRLLRTMKLLLK